MHTLLLAAIMTLGLLAIPLQPADAATGQELKDMALKVEAQYVPYCYGGTSLSGMDCGGLVYYVAKQCGITLPKQQYNQRYLGTAVDYSAVKHGDYTNLQPGDLLFFCFYGSGSDHAGVYVGDGKMVHMSSGSSDSVLSPLTASNGRGGTWLSSLCAVRRVADGYAYDLAYCEHVRYDMEYDLTTQGHPHLQTYVCQDCGYTWYGQSSFSDTCGICCPGQYLLSFDSTDGEEDFPEITVDYGYAYGELPTPTLDDAIFMGWYTEPEGGTKITAANTVLLHEDTTLYAQWADAEEAGLENFFRSLVYSDGLFTDVEDDWYTENIAAAYEYGLMNGESETNFDIDGQVTLGQAVALACRLHATYYQIDYDFSFVPNPQWYQVFVTYAEENGFLLDLDNPDYDAPVSREQFASLLAHAFPEEALEPVNEVADASIPDVQENDLYAGDIYLLYRAGVLTGTNHGVFGMGEDVTRTEAAALVTRMADESLRQYTDLVSTTTVLSDTVSADGLLFLTEEEDSSLSAD